MNARRCFSTILFLLLPAVFPWAPLCAWTVLARGGEGPPGDRSPAAVAVEHHDVSDVYLVVSNIGPIGNNPLTGGDENSFPAGTLNNYVFGSGLWFAAVYDVDEDGTRDTVWTVAYDPAGAASEFREGRSDQEPGDPGTKVFDSTEPGDIGDWPPQFRDPLGQAVVCSDQDLVTSYTTTGSEPGFGIANMPLQVHQRSMALVAPDSLDQVIIFHFVVRNTGLQVLEDSWIGFDSDMDIGQAFEDDQASLIERVAAPGGDTVSLRMGLAWDSDFSEENFTGLPGFVGVSFLLTPGNPHDAIDNDGDGQVDESPANGMDDDGDFEIDEWDEVDEMGLVNFSFHSNPGLPGGPRPDPLSEEAGYRFISCTPPQECLETDIAWDIRFMLSSGPFDWHPGEVQRIVVAFVFANAMGAPDHLDLVGDPPRPDPRDSTLAELVRIALRAREYFPALIDCSGTVGISEDPGESPADGGHPRSFSLSQNYPNPFNPATEIEVHVPGQVPSRCSLVIRDVRGRVVRRLLDRDLSPGRHTVVWNGEDERGIPIGSGIYLYTLGTGNRSITKKMILKK